MFGDVFLGEVGSRQKGAIKLHLTLDHAGYLPEAMVITTGKYSELTVGRGDDAMNGEPYW